MDILYESREFIFQRRRRAHLFVLPYTWSVLTIQTQRAFQRAYCTSTAGLRIHMPHGKH